METCGASIASFSGAGAGRFGANSRPGGGLGAKSRPGGGAAIRLGGGWSARRGGEGGGTGTLWISGKAATASLSSYKATLQFRYKTVHSGNQAIFENLPNL